MGGMMTMEMLKSVDNTDGCDAKNVLYLPFLDGIYRKYFLTTCNDHFHLFTEEGSVKKMPFESLKEALKEDDDEMKEKVGKKVTNRIGLTGIHKISDFEILCSFDLVRDNQRKATISEIIIYNLRTCKITKKIPVKSRIIHMTLLPQESRYIVTAEESLGSKDGIWEYFIRMYDLHGENETYTLDTKKHEIGSLDGLQSRRKLLCSKHHPSAVFIPHFMTDIIERKDKPTNKDELNTVKRDIYLLSLFDFSSKQVIQHAGVLSDMRKMYKNRSTSVGGRLCRTLMINCESYLDDNKNEILVVLNRDIIERRYGRGFYRSIAYYTNFMFFNLGKKGDPDDDRLVRYFVPFKMFRRRGNFKSIYHLKTAYETIFFLPLYVFDGIAVMTLLSEDDESKEKKLAEEREKLEKKTSKIRSGERRRFGEERFEVRREVFKEQVVCGFRFRVYDIKRIGGMLGDTKGGRSPLSNPASLGKFTRLCVISIHGKNDPIKICVPFSGRDCGSKKVVKDKRIIRIFAYNRMISSALGRGFMEVGKDGKVRRNDEKDRKKCSAEFACEFLSIRLCENVIGKDVMIKVPRVFLFSRI